MGATQKLLGALQQHRSTAAAAGSTAAATRGTKQQNRIPAAVTVSITPAYGNTPAAAYDYGAQQQLQQLLGVPQQLILSQSSSALVFSRNKGAQEQKTYHTMFSATLMIFSLSITQSMACNNDQSS